MDFASRCLPVKMTQAQTSIIDLTVLAEIKSCDIFKE